MEQLFTFPTEELQQEDTVYVTIALELHATTLTNDKDRIQFENLVNQAKKELKDSDLEEKDKLLEQLDVIDRHRDELVSFIGGLAIYLTADDIYYYHLAIPVIDRVRIDKLPYVQPLASNYQYTRDYHLLVLNRESIRLFEGHSGNIEELPIDEIEDAPVDLETALGTEKEGGAINFGAYNAGNATPGTGQFFHGHGDASEEKDIDRRRYFQMVDDFVFDNFSSEMKLPLILYSVDENQAVFREFSKNQYLQETGIKGSAAGLPANDIQERVEQTIDEIVARQREELLNQLNETTPENRIDNIPDDLAVASQRGQIESLYLQKGFEIPGSINGEGRYDPDAEEDNFIDQIVHNVMRAGGDIYILDPTETPEDIEISARLRYS